MTEYDKQLAEYRRRRRKILAMAATGMRGPEIARALQISRQRVNQIIREERR